MIRRVALQSDLDSSGLTLYPSAASFVLFGIPPEIDPNAFWEYMILKYRIVLRSCGNYEALAKGHFRAAVRTQSENKKLAIEVMKALSALQ
jgi:threonine-phosphate decarboxylase